MSRSLPHSLHGQQGPARTRLLDHGLPRKIKAVPIAPPDWSRPPPMPSLTMPLSRRSLLQAIIALGLSARLYAKPRSHEYSSLILVADLTQEPTWIDQFRCDIASRLGTSCDVPACAIVGPGQDEEACRLIAAGVHFVAIEATSAASVTALIRRLSRSLAGRGLAGTLICPVPQSAQSLRRSLGIE